MTCNPILHPAVYTLTEYQLLISSNKHEKVHIATVIETSFKHDIAIEILGVSVDENLNFSHHVMFNGRLILRGDFFTFASPGLGICQGGQLGAWEFAKTRFLFNFKSTMYCMF